jgi:hypothetical protein
MDLRQQLTLAQRMNNRVGVVEPLKNPVTLTIRQPDCYRIERAFIDGDQLTAYITNHCTDTPNYAQLHWEVVAPDGTIIQHGYENYKVPKLSPGETGEISVELPSDPRAAKVVTWSQL